MCATQLKRRKCVEEKAGFAKLPLISRKVWMEGGKKFSKAPQSSPLAHQKKKGNKNFMTENLVRPMG